MTLASGWLPAVKNKILLANGATVGYLTSYTLADYQLLNAQVCRTGGGTIINGGPECGQINLRDQNRVSCPPSNPSCSSPVIHHQWEVNFDSVGGDSGGPYYDPDASNNVSFYGTHTHSTDPCVSNCHGWYSPGDWVYSAIQDEMQVTILYYCVNSSCSAP